MSTLNAGTKCNSLWNGVPIKRLYVGIKDQIIKQINILNIIVLFSSLESGKEKY